MCGIVGYIGYRDTLPILVEGLRKLEYRGYDSAGIATVIQSNGSLPELNLVRAKGKLQNLELKLADDLPSKETSRVGIGHTRWATHGKPEEYNAHPHLDTLGRLAVIQNGIIENYSELREELKAKGHQFRSDTDTEVIPHLIAEYLPGHSLLQACQQAVQKLQGAFAVVVMSADFPDELIAIRQQAPLILGIGKDENFCASDVPAIIEYTQKVLVLNNGELARLTPKGIQLFNFAGDKVRRAPQTVAWNPVMVEKQGFRHFMLKEIYEQPGVVRASLEGRIAETADVRPVTLNLPKNFLSDVDRIHIVACGTSWHAALVGKFLLEELTRIPTEVSYASEFRYSTPPLTPSSLVIGVTQSGETADTLAALEVAKDAKTKLLGITNRPESSLARLVPALIDTRAGIEIGVAATKTFTAQLVAFYLLALNLAYERKTCTPERMQFILQELREVPARMEEILETQERYIEELAKSFEHTRDFIYIGRGINYPIALEGALKLKEISYIHAEGYPAGEMKHGPIALLDADCPVVTVAVPGKVYEKVLSNAQEAKARDAKLIGVTPRTPLAEETFDTILPFPNVDEIVSPLLTVLPLQLLAYHIAARKGQDVDQPRNLAKSVTVE